MIFVDDFCVSHYLQANCINNRRPTI